MANTPGVFLLNKQNTNFFLGITMTSVTSEMENIINKIGPCLYVKGFGRPTHEAHKKGEVTREFSAMKSSTASMLRGTDVVDEGEMPYLVSHGLAVLKPMIAGRERWSAQKFTKGSTMWRYFPGRTIKQLAEIDDDVLQSLQFKSATNILVITTVAKIIQQPVQSIALASIIPVELLERTVSNYFKNNAADLTAERILQWN